jgi:hypothetical protein
MGTIFLVIIGLILLPYAVYVLAMSIGVVCIMANECWNMLPPLCWLGLVVLVFVIILV